MNSTIKPMRVLLPWLILVLAVSSVTGSNPKNGTVSIVSNEIGAAGSRAEGLGELHFYPKPYRKGKFGEKLKLTVNFANKTRTALKLRKMYEVYERKCPSAVKFNSGNDRCNSRDSFGLAANYSCFFLRLENTDNWFPQGYTETSFLPDYNQSFIPVTCYTTAGFHFTPFKSYEHRISLWPQFGFPRDVFPMKQRENRCAPLITGVIDDDHLIHGFFEFKQLRCRVWDFAKLKTDRIVVNMAFQNWRNNGTIETTSFTTTIPTVSTRDKPDSGDEMDELLERRDPTLQVEDQYADLLQ